MINGAWWGGGQIEKLKIDWRRQEGGVEERRIEDEGFWKGGRKEERGEAGGGRLDGSQG